MAQGIIFILLMPEQWQLPLATAHKIMTVSSTILLPDASSGKYLRDDMTWQTIAGGGDMLKSTYDYDEDGVIAKAQLDTDLANTSGTNTGDQTAIPNSDLAQMATKTYKGRTAALTGTPEDVAVATLKTDLALNNVDNTTDAGKPVSTAQQTALDLKAPLASPTFTGTVTLPTALTGVIRADSGVVSVDADVTDIVAAASETAAGKIEIAIQTEIETGTDVTRAVVPGYQQFHPSAAKFWASILGTGASISASYNVTSISDTGAGDVAVTIATDFSGATWACVATIERINSTTTVTNAKKVNIKTATQAAGSISLQCWDSTATNQVIEDPQQYHIVGYGDQ